MRLVLSPVCVLLSPYAKQESQNRIGFLMLLSNFDIFLPWFTSYIIFSICSKQFIYIYFVFIIVVSYYSSEGFFS